MSTPLSADPKDILQRYLQTARDALVWKLDGLDDYDARRPMTPTGTNLLGLIKHMAAIEAGYLGSCFGRPLPDAPAYFAEMDDPDSEPNLDMWATADEPRDELIALYRRACAHGDATIADLDLDAVGTVPWWGPAAGAQTLERLLVHLLAETNRHCGQADIVRELIDESVGMRADVSNVPDLSPQWWAEYRARLQRTAETFRR